LIEARGKGLTLTWDVQARVPEVLAGDQIRLGQVLTNLVGNAIKFTDRGQITVSVELESLSTDEATLRFCVRDTGIGIKPEHREGIFEAFSQVDSSSTRCYGGVGLGLAIARRLVAVLGGRIWVESELEKGSAFHFTARFGLTEVIGSGPTGKDA